MTTGSVHRLTATPADAGIVGCTEAFDVVDEFGALPPEKRGEAALGNVVLASGRSGTVEGGATANLSCTRNGLAPRTEQRTG